MRNSKCILTAQCLMYLYSCTLGNQFDLVGSVTHGYLLNCTKGEDGHIRQHKINKHCYYMCEEYKWIEICCTPPLIFHLEKMKCDFAYRLLELVAVTNSSTVTTSTSKPDRCELKGECNITGSFLSLGTCENCYCFCNPALRWSELCCPPGLIWNPNAWPNPNSCDDPDNIPDCGSSGSNFKAPCISTFRIELFYFSAILLAKLFVY